VHKDLVVHGGPVRRTIPFSGPFTTAEAYAAGLTSGILRGPSVRRLFAGVYVRAEVEVSEQILVAAALKVVPQAVVVGVTALRLHGVDIGPPKPLYLVSSNPHPVRRAGLNVARVGALPPHSGSVAVAEHAFASAASQLNLLDLVTAGDWLVRGNRCRLPALQAYASNFTGRGAVAARRAAGFVRARVDSVPETRLRLCLVLAELPTPDCNLVMGTHARPIGRVDLVFREFGVLIEYEGNQHRTDGWQWNIDIGRYEDFTVDGYVVIRVTGAAMRRPREVVCRVDAALRSHGYRGPAPRFSPEWCLLFEQSPHVR
jgi:hypothetical protein